MVEDQTCCQLHQQERAAFATSMTWPLIPTIGLHRHLSSPRCEGHDMHSLPRLQQSSLMGQAAGLKLLSSCRGGWHVPKVRLQPLPINICPQRRQVLAHCQY